MGDIAGGVDRSEEEQFMIRVGVENDAPVALGQSVETEEDTGLAITLGGVDVDGDSLSYEIVGLPGHGVLSGAAGGAERRYEPEANYSGTDRFTYRVSDGQEWSQEAEVVVEVGSVNDAPAGVVEVRPLAQMRPGQAGLWVIAADNVGALVVLDGSRSSDVEGDELEYGWLEEGMAVGIRTGAVVTNWFGVGVHRVVLLVDDGEDVGSVEVEFEVITPATALEEVVWMVAESGLERNRKQPLLASLKVAGASFDRGSVGSAINQLEAFLNKVRAQVAPLDEELAAELSRAVRSDGRFQSLRVGGWGVEELAWRWFMRCVKRRERAEARIPRVRVRTAAAVLEADDSG
jgi:hypothetical protein